MNYAFREWNGTEGKRGGERANLARRGRERDREREREKFPPDAAAKKQKLLPKIAGSTERSGGDRGGTDSHKRGPKVLCLFFGMQLREGGRGFEEWKLYISLFCQFHRAEKKPYQIFKKKESIVPPTPTLEQTFGSF